MIETGMTDWDRLPTGEIETSPVVSWAVAAMPLNVLLRLEILTETGQIGTAQVHIPASHIADLTTALTAKAVAALSSPTTGQA